MPFAPCPLMPYALSINLFALRLFLFSAFRIPTSEFLTPSALCRPFLHGPDKTGTDHFIHIILDLSGYVIIGHFFKGLSNTGD